jgi:hypothetical protein
VLAVRVADVVAVEAVDGTGLLAPAAADPVRDGDLVAWCTVVAVAPAVLDEDGRLGADGWLPDHVRLGGLEEHLGDGVLERVVTQTAPAPSGPERRRLMSLPLVARLVMAMTMMPNASYVEAFAQLVGVRPACPGPAAGRSPSRQWSPRGGAGSG